MRLQPFSLRHYLPVDPVGEAGRAGIGQAVQELILGRALRCRSLRRLADLLGHKDTRMVHKHLLGAALRPAFLCHVEDSRDRNCCQADDDQWHACSYEEAKDGNDRP